MTPASHTPSTVDLASRLLDDVDGLAAEFCDAIIREIDLYGEQALVGREQLHESLVANLRLLLGQLSGQPGGDLDAPRKIGRERAESDVPLPEVLRAYRLGFRYLWQRMLAAAREQAGSGATDALLDAATDIWQLVDDYSLALTESYRATMSERMIEADRRRSGIVARLLEGPSADGHSAWEVAQLLRFPYDGRFLVLVAEAGSTAPLPRLTDRLRQLDVATAWRAQPEHEIGVLSLGRRTSDEVIDAVRQSAAARVGVSPAYEHLDDTVRALRLAQVAMDSLPAGVADVRQLPDEPLTDLLVRDFDTTRAYAERVLAGLLAIEGDDREVLLATARTWIEARGSAADASRVLFCHENTVRHRLHRLEEHLHIDLGDPRQLRDLTTALQALSIFPRLADQAGPHG